MESRDSSIPAAPLEDRAEAGNDEPCELAAGGVEVFGTTDPGLVRPTNQDQFLIAELGRTLSICGGSLPERASNQLSAVQGRLLVVADGVGGYDGGELASAIAIDTFVSLVLEVLPWLAPGSTELKRPVLETLRTSVRAADEAVHRAAMELGLDERMSTTLTAAYIAWPDVYLVHVGDSRCYLRRGAHLAQLTIDHTVTEDTINDGRPLLFNTVGGTRNKELMVEGHAFDLQEGDELLLCTDGVAAHVDQQELETLLARPSSVEARVRALLGIVNEHGATDNTTVILARFQMTEHPDSAPPSH